jgi:hypothetical protein
VDRLVPVQTLRHQLPCLEPHRGLIAKRVLIFDDGMQHRMHRRIRQLDAQAAVVVEREVDPSLFVRRQPLRCIRGLQRIVAVNSHVRLLRQIARRRTTQGAAQTGRYSVAVTGIAVATGLACHHDALASDSGCA